MGVAEARRNGLKKSIGEYIAWVDPDDMVTDQWFETIKNMLENCQVYLEKLDLKLTELYQQH